MDSSQKYAAAQHLLTLILNGNAIWAWNLDIIMISERICRLEFTKCQNEVILKCNSISQNDCFCCVCICIIFDFSNCKPELKTWNADWN